MSDAHATPFKVDLGPGVKEQIEAIKPVAQQSGQLSQFIQILEKAYYLLKNDPHGWGDPAYRSKHVDAVYCHATIRPVAFRYVIYDAVRGVVLLSVRSFAEFD